MTQSPLLPVLDDITDALAASGHGSLCEGAVFVCVQHLLDSTGSMIEALIRLGARPSDIFILGKRYSSSPEVLDRLRSIGVQVSDAGRPNRWQEFGKTFDGDVRRMWEHVMESRLRDSQSPVVVLDDGGHCILHTPKQLVSRTRVVSVEQTTSGLKKIARARFPVINVASSAVKRYVEAPLVAETVLAKTLASVPDLPMRSIGIIGFGSIGAALASSAAAKGNKRIFAFDTDPVKVGSSGSSVHCCGNLSEVLKNADVIFGCTGENLEIARQLPTLGGKKVLVSCSSEDREFHTLVQQFYKNNLIAFSEYEADIPLKYGPTEIRLLRGGFPINFDHSPESVPNEDIQVTRGLLLGAVSQALVCSETPAVICNLDPSLQRFVLDSWFGAHPEKLQKFQPELLSPFSAPDWIERESGPHPGTCEGLSRVFRARRQSPSAVVAHA
jgi:hypothetical protein